MVEDSPRDAPAAPKRRRARAASPPAKSTLSAWERVKEHKVLQWSLAYLGAALALAHGQELLAHTFHWPELVGRLLMIGLIVGFPMAIVLAWYHGHKGFTHITAAEMTALAGILLIAGAVLTLMARSGHGSDEATRASGISAASGAPSSTAATPSHGIAGPQPGVAKKVRLAIMPFENLSPDPANAFFTDGLQEEILSTLAQRAPELEVISRTTMRTFRDHPKPVSEVAKDLGATHVIEGSVRREANNVRLTLQLINARTDDHMWAHDYDRQLGSAMTLQAEVAKEVAAQLAVELSGGGRRAETLTRDPEAYDLYLKGRLALQSLHLVSPTEQFRAAETALGQAIQRDPGFGLAYVARFDVRLLIFCFNVDNIDTVLQEMQLDLDAVRRLMPNTAALQSLEGLWAFVNRDYPRALALLSAAETAGYADSETLRARADVMGRMGLYQEALPVIARAVELDPANSTMVFYQGVVFGYVGRATDSLRTFELFKQRVPNAGPLPDQLQDQIRFLYRGELKALIDTANHLPSNDPSISPFAFYNVTILQHRYKDARAYAERVPARMRTGDFHLLVPYGVGEVPAAAMLQGSADMLLGDSADARKKARVVLNFIAEQRVSPQNDWFLKMLESMGHWFNGDTAGSVAAARESLALMPRSRDAVDWTVAAYNAAIAFAWAGQEAEAMNLLEQVCTSVPRIGPGQVTHDPLLTVPLAKSARYQALVKKLEAQMAAARS